MTTQNTPQNELYAINSYQTDLSPYKMKLARAMSQDMAQLQVKELLGMDILNKLGNLSQLRDEILTRSPSAEAELDYILKAFAYYSSEYLRYEE